MQTKKGPSWGRKKERIQKESHSVESTDNNEWVSASFIPLLLPVTTPARVKKEHQ